MLVHRYIPKLATAGVCISLLPDLREDVLFTGGGLKSKEGVTVWNKCGTFGGLFGQNKMRDSQGFHILVR